MTDSVPNNKTNNDGEKEKEYSRSQSAHQFSTNDQEDQSQVKHLPRIASAAPGAFSVIYEVPTDADESGITFAPPPSASSSNFHHQQQTRRSTGTGSFERQLSILDPMSDRVSTILVWKDLVVFTREDKKKQIMNRLKGKDSEPKTKRLLHNVSGAITGGLWAVMGPSGSGKSTLLNTLACRLDVNTVYTGEMRLNGAPYDNAELKRVSGYVMQDDLLNGYLTVEETLMYTAELRLPRTFTDAERKQRVEEVLKDLGLEHVRHDIIGSQSKQGISGSERKRLCAGMQMLNRPQLLFLDEPTTGLDSVTALDLLYTLHAIAHGKAEEKAVTVVCSIHQPQTKIFNLFDSMILLKAGHIIYQGSRKQAPEVFRAAGFPCPLYTNPADHLLDVITPPKSGPSKDGKPPLTVEEQAAVDQAIMKAQPPLEIDLNMGANKRLAQMDTPLHPNWFKQVRILVRRNLREQSRKTFILITSILQTVIMGILIGTVFLRIGNTQKSIVRREPVIFFCAINQGVFGALTVINSFPVERTLTLRERASGTYFASAYFIAKAISDMLVQLPIPIIFTCVVYFLIGLQAEAGKFFLFMLFIILCSISSTSVALMISALCRTTSLSVTVLPMVLEVARLFGGFFVAPSRVPKYLSWIDALSYVKYCFVGAAKNELNGLELNCIGATTHLYNTTTNITVSSCITNGEYFIKERGYDYISIGGCIGVLLSFIIFCRFWAFIGVRFLKH